MQSAYEIEVLRPSELTPQRIARWRELQQSAPELDTPYLSPGWARVVEQVQGPRVPRVAIVRQSGRDVGFLPASVVGLAIPVARRCRAARRSAHGPVRS